MGKLSLFKTVPPRVFALPSEKSQKLIVIVRKKSKLTGVYVWDVKTNDIKLSQWLKGRIYEYFSDISSDGKHFLYSANKKGEGYTVISRAPWLKAITLWRNVGGYGGGVFYGGKSYALYDGSEAYCELKNGEFKPVKNDELWQIGGVYPLRLKRLGWAVKSKNETEMVFCKPVHKNMILEKIWYRNKGNEIGRGGFCEAHRLVSDLEAIELPTWEWCEIVGNQMVWAEKGCLFTVALKADINTPTLIADFNNAQFKERTAPY